MEKQYRLLVIPLLLFLISYVFVSSQNRFASDDFEFLNKLREFGVMGSVKWFHENWNTRWASITLLNFILLFSIQSGSLVWYHLISLTLLWLAFYRNIRNRLSQGRRNDLLNAGYAATAFFFACFSISDVFFWVNTSTMYLYGCIALLFAVAEITTKTHSVASYFRLAGFSLFLSGAYEPLVFTCMLVCIMLLGYFVRSHGWRVWLFPVDKKIIILLSALLLGFAISYSGDGHVVRSLYLPQTGFAFKLWVWIKAVGKMFVFYVPAKLLPVLLFSLPWFLLGASGNFYWLNPAVLKRVTAAFVLLVSIALLPVAFIMSEMGPERAWTQVSLYLTLYVGFVACYSGKALRMKPMMNNVVGIYVFIGGLYLAATGISAGVKAIGYRNAYDARIATILTNQKTVKKDPFYLKPLPDSGWLHTAELGANPGHFNNIFLKTYFDLDFDVIVK
ncbi:MAG: hypothetical protein M3Q95_09950 [Bacteroidota bacterium]|nr:hypothetical protein [Bacteroidota bacterium]